MRRYLSIIFGSFLLSLVACNGNLDELDRTPDGNGKIIVSAKSLGVTRSADTDVESTLAWIDVYVMDESKNIVHSERIDKSTSPVVGGGEFTLSKNREDFEKNKGYYFYMIANSTEPLSTAKTWDELKKLSQRDEHLHLSGISEIEDLTVPKYFLMDGFAYVPTAGSTTAPAEMPLMVLNNGVNDDDLILGGTLVRAASKIIIKIMQGDSVEFKSSLEDGNGNVATPLYSYYQLPISTLMVRPDATTFFNSEKQNTKEWGIDNRNQSFNWITDDKNPQHKLTLVGYAYANDWSKNPANESALLLSIPMMWDKDGDLDKEESNGKEAASLVNWYKVPLSKNDKFERNKCYVINITINAVGAEEQNTPIELKDIEYETLDWVKEPVSLGDTQAKYLTLNTDLVKIYDTNFDLDQLTFASSSPIKSIKLKDTFNESNGSITALKVTKESDGTTEVEYEEGDGVYAYYIDKFGKKVQLGTDPGFDIKDIDHNDWSKDFILEKEKNLYDKDGVVYNEQYIRAEVPADQARALNGNIHIYTPINAVAGNDDLNWNSHFNTVRYLEFEVMNEQGLTATFRVEQRPTVVITNEEGYFSYRTDQKLTDDQKEATHFHNYQGFESFHCTGLYFYHEHEWSKEFEKTDEWWAENRNERDYSWVVPQACPANQENSGVDVVNYGNIGNPVSWRNSNGVLQNKVYGGIYRPTTHPTEYFFRWRYNGIGASNNDSQGLAISGLYEKTDTVNGEPVKRWYRKHYVWNVQIVFYNLYVSKVWKEDGVDENSISKLKGQADIRSMTHAQTTYVGGSATGWGSWGLQKTSNHRMYNIYTSNTHMDYTIGYPVLAEDAVPKNTPDNAKIISPNLMIASQLGSTYHQSIIASAASYKYKVPVVGEFFKIAEEHCREYVETTFIDKNDNGVWDEGEKVIHYDDWRLPTKAEIDRIIEFQESSRAMDKLLTNQYYFCITGNGEKADINKKENWISNEVPNASSTGYYIRCVRDAGRKNK